jgi:hypothetical protein
MASLRADDMTYILYSLRACYKMASVIWIYKNIYRNSIVVKKPWVSGFPTLPRLYFMATEITDPK